MGVELLGSIYEQFLGKVIRLTRGHNAKIEEKPEVKKAGGVYYTPRYIVEYIVKNTVGELVKGKTPKQVEKIKILDPACGSGSFLIGAYEFLLDWHLSEYGKLSDRKKINLEKKGVLYKQVNEESTGKSIANWNLTTSEKKRIMLNNIYGVDTDAQAVEVTKLSLALKVLENENQESINQQMKLFAERILPDLGGNIKCGNSLVGSDYWDGKDLGEVSEEEIRKINAFDWDVEFEGIIGDKPIKVIIDNGADLKRIKRLRKEGKIIDAEAHGTEDCHSKHGVIQQGVGATVGRSQVNGKDMIVDDKFGKISKCLMKAVTDPDAIHLYSAYLNEADCFITNNPKDFIKNGRREKLESILGSKVRILTIDELDLETKKIIPGGFDAVIGNPPYVKEYIDKSAFIFKDSQLGNYYQGKMDLWYAFTCLGIDILKKKGLLGFIAPNNWITNAGASILRHKLIKTTLIQQYIDFNNYKVFENANIQTMIFVLKKGSNKPQRFQYKRIISKDFDENNLVNYLLKDKATYEVESYKVELNKNIEVRAGVTFLPSEINQIVEKLQCVSNYTLPKSDIVAGIDVHQDFVTQKHLEKLNSDFERNEGIFNISNEELKGLTLTNREIDEVMRPFYTTNELGKYYGSPINRYWVIYTDKKRRENIDQYPNIKKHLLRFKRVITSDTKPFGLHRSREERFFRGKKIISLRKTMTGVFTYTNFDCYVSQTYYIIKPKDISLKYLTALLNSKLVYFWLYHKGKKQGEQLQIDKAPLLTIPLIKTDNTIIKQKLIGCSEKQLSLHKQLSEVKGERKKKMIQQQIDKIDEQINQEVYKLYGLSKEEIDIIEGGRNETKRN